MVHGSATRQFSRYRPPFPASSGLSQLAGAASVPSSCNPVANLRTVTATDPEVPDLAALVAELRAASSDFARLWERHDVQRRRGETKSFAHRSLSLSDSERRPAGGRERSSAAWPGGRPRRPVAVFRHRAVAAAKPSGDPPSLARARRGGAQGVALTPRSVRSRRCHTCPSAHLRAFNAQHHDSTRTQYRVRKLTADDRALKALARLAAQETPAGG